MMTTPALPYPAWSVSEAVPKGNRDAIAYFWLAAPVDMLESFWASPLGQITKDLTLQLHSDFPFTQNQIDLRSELNNHLQKGLDQPNCLGVIIANFLFSPPGLFRISTPEIWMPNWLLFDYKALYENQPTAEFISSPEVPSESLPEMALPTPDFGPFPTSLQELVGNRIQLNRILGLSNLYYIDPEDTDILNELLVLRRQFARAIEVCSESDLERLWATDLGDRYWALVRSGVQVEVMSSEDQSLKSNAADRLSPSKGGGFSTPGAVNSFLISMLFYLPGTMKVDDASNKIPSWLLEGYNEVFAKPLRSSL